MWDLVVKESVWCPLRQAKTGRSASEARCKGEDPRHLLESRDRSIQRQKRFLPGPVPVEYVYPRERGHVGVVERGARCPPEPPPRGATRAPFFWNCAPLVLGPMFDHPDAPVIFSKQTRLMDIELQS